MRLNELEAGKIYRPIGPSFGKLERRNVRFVGSNWIVFEDENGHEFVAKMNEWPFVEYREVVDFFEAGSHYSYTRGVNNYRIIEVNETNSMAVAAQEFEGKILSYCTLLRLDYENMKMIDD